MDVEENNKALGITHLVYGGLNALIVFGLAFLTGAFIWSMLALQLAVKGGSVSLPLTIAIIALIFFLFLPLLLIPFIAGYGLLNKKSWARTAGIVSAIVAAPNFPFGTAVCAYSLWFLFGDGKRLYGGVDQTPVQRPVLGDRPSAAGWTTNANTNSPEREYVPPAQPPDWRGE